MKALHEYESSWESIKKKKCFSPKSLSRLNLELLAELSLILLAVLDVANAVRATVTASFIDLLSRRDLTRTLRDSLPAINSSSSSRNEVKRVEETSFEETTAKEVLPPVTFSCALMMEAVMFFAFSDTLTVGVTEVANGDVDVKDSAVESMTQVRNNGNLTVAVILSGFF